MRMRKQTVFRWTLISIVAFTIAVSIFLAIIAHRNIYSRRVLGSQVNIINRKSVVHSPESKLKYYYEPIAYATESAQPDWLPAPVTYTINGEGLNERLDYPVEKYSGDYRIITLGDSFTYGAYVNTKDNWPEQLEDLLNNHKPCDQYVKYEVINLGMGGYDIQYSVERYRLHGVKYSPDIVIWLLHDNDFQQIAEEIRSMEPLYLSLRPVQKGTPNELEKQTAITDIATKEFIDKHPESYLLSQQYSFLLKITQYYQGDLIVISLPQIGKQYIESLKRFANERPSTSYHELRNIYNEQFGGSYNPDDPHPNTRGHTIIAEDVYDILSKRRCQ